MTASNGFAVPDSNPKTVIALLIHLEIMYSQSRVKWKGEVTIQNALANPRMEKNILLETFEVIVHTFLATASALRQIATNNAMLFNLGPKMVFFEFSSIRIWMIFSAQYSQMCEMSMDGNGCCNAAFFPDRL